MEQKIEIKNYICSKEILIWTNLNYIKNLEYYGTNKEGNSKQVFLADLFIFESERRKGYASDAINEVNKMAKNDCCSSSALFVWEHNSKGLGLYEKCGYKYFQQSDGGIFMLKEL